jgi:anthranilate phosphoribosyltransferase
MNVKEKFEKLFANELGEEEAREFLVGLYEKGESPEEVTAAVEVMREHSVKLPLSPELRERAIDIVGTGGDKSGSFNISTTVSLLLASTGAVVAKHGNRSITSKSGRRICWRPWGTTSPWGWRSRCGCWRRPASPSSSP